MAETRRVRAAAVALAAAPVLLLGACSGSTGTEGADETQSAASSLGPSRPATGTPIRLGVVGTESPENDLALAGYRAVTAYANEHLGGINGHPIELEECSTQMSPSTATRCGVTFAQTGVAAVLAGVVGDSLSVHDGMDGRDIPFLAQIAADADILAGHGSFVLSNPVLMGTAGITIAQENDVTHAAVVVIDVPSATGPVKSGLGPLYDAAGITLDVVPVSLQVPDPTAQVQHVLAEGAQLLTVYGDAVFLTTVTRAARQLGFTGPILTQVSGLGADEAASIPGGAQGITTIGTISQAPGDHDRVLYENVMAAYAPGVDASDDVPQVSFQVELALIRALAEVPGVGTDPASVGRALATMPDPVPLPLGGGITFQCGADVVVLVPAVCTADVLRAPLGTDGRPTSEEVLTPFDMWWPDDPAGLSPSPSS